MGRFARSILHRCRNEADVAFLALPEAASAEVAPALIAARAARRGSIGGVSSPRRSGTQAMVSGHACNARRGRLRLDRVRTAAVMHGSACLESRVLSDRGAVGAAAVGASAG